MNGISWPITSSLLPWSSRWTHFTWCSGTQLSIPLSTPPPTSILTISSLIFSASSPYWSLPFNLQADSALNRYSHLLWWRSSRLRWTSQSASLVMIELFRNQSHHRRRHYHYLPVRAHLCRADQEICVWWIARESLWRKGKILYHDHEGYRFGIVYHTLVQLQFDHHEGRLVLPRKLEL